MPFKEFNLTPNVKIRITKRSSSRKLKLSIAEHNLVKVSIPKWTPYVVGYKFALSKKKWILAKLPTPTTYFNNQEIAKYHILKLIKGNYSRISYKIKGDEILVYIPAFTEDNNLELQLSIQKAIDKALLDEAHDILKKRINSLATKFDLNYKDLKFKKLKSKWGSCDQNKILTFNINLLFLNWNLIDYVIIHELNHLEHMNHSKLFWEKLENEVPNYKNLRKELKSYHF